jgi:hypothetical protein
MDRRLQERIPAQFHATVTRVAPRERPMRGRVDNVSKAGVCVVLPRQLAPGDLVELDMADSLLFGHVVFCNPQPGEYRTGIEIERVLLGETDLSQLLNDLLATESPAAAP